MRAFIIAVVAMIAVGVVAWLVLDTLQTPSDAAFSTDGVRL